MSFAEASIITAMITPFTETGEIDFAQLPTLIDYLLDHHTEGLVVAGTTGESPTLSHSEKIALFKETVQIVAGRVPIICGVGSNNTQETVEFAQEVSQIEGIDALLCVVPYYNKPTQEGLYQHFKTIADASPLPIVLYNVPGRTIVGLTPQTTLRLAEHPNIIGTKECEGSAVLGELIDLAPADFMVYSGEDELAFTAKAIGCKGIISVASHVVGDEMHAMYTALKAGNIEEAGRLQRDLSPKMAAVFSAPSPTPVKAVYNAWGIPAGSVRLPLLSCTQEQTEAVLKALAKTNHQ